MTHAFIVLLDLDDGIDLTTVAEELTRDLDDFDVVSIHPWAQHTLGAGAPSPLSLAKPMDGNLTL